MRFYELLFCRVDLQNFFQSVLNNKFRKQCSVSWHLPDFVLKKVENNVYVISLFSDKFCFVHYISSGNYLFVVCVCNQVVSAEESIQ